MKSQLQQKNKLLTEALFADRMTGIPRSFIREILKVASGNDVISFAGGLPNPELFPVSGLHEACNRVLNNTGPESLQYSNSEGFLPLREYIAERYKTVGGIPVDPKNILITSGSQQGLDLLAKVFINPGDEVIIEEPGYLGAIQAMSIFQPQFLPVPLHSNGLDAIILSNTLRKHKPKLMYVVPDFQNPSGISYTENVRKEIAQIVSQHPILLVEDNPYSDIRFAGSRKNSFYHYLPNQTILLGTFSKTAVPGFRLGWLVAPDEVMDRLIIAKQAADLHTNSFTQRVLYEYLKHNQIDEHIRTISEVYGTQCRAMLSGIREFFPGGVKYTQPEGGMFLWITLPSSISAMDVFNEAIKQKVAFVPGDPFYINRERNCSAMRLNYSCTKPETIKKGMAILGNILYKML